MTLIEELRKIEDELVNVELWLFSHKKDLDARRLEVYGTLKRIIDTREREKEETRGKGGAKPKQQSWRDE